MKLTPFHNVERPNKYSFAEVRDKTGFEDKIPPVPKLFDQVREVIRLKHYCIRTGQAYVIGFTP